MQGPIIDPESEKVLTPQPGDLSEQAAELRQAGKRSIAGFSPEAPLWRKCVYLTGFVLVLLGVVYLLIFEDSRRRVIDRVGGGWQMASGQVEARFFKLPPPPVEEKLIRSARSSAPIQFQVVDEDDEDPGGILYLNRFPDGTAVGEPEEEKSAAPEVAAKTAEATSAYELLQTESKAAQQVVSNQIAGLTFNGWAPVKNDPPRHYIKLIATRNGSEVPLIWLIDLEKGTVRPLSQEARDLAARFK